MQQATTTELDTTSNNVTTASNNETNIVKRTSLRASKKQFEAFEKNLKILEASLNRSDEVKNRAVQILDRFETRFEKLEKQMNQMNETIDVLKLTHDNVEKTLLTVDNVIAQYNIPKEVERRIDRGVDGDLESFFRAMDMRESADQFFTKHPKFKNAKEVLSKLSEVKTSAIEELEREFYRLIKKEALVLDPNRLLKPLAEGIELFTEEALEEMSNIAMRLDELSAVSYRKKYIEIRDQAIKDILNKIYPDQKGKLGSSSNTKSSDKFIFFMTYYLEVLKAERDLAKKLIFGQQTTTIFAEVIKNSINIFISKAELIAERNQTNEKIFTLLDVLEIFNTKLKPQFKRVLEDTVHSSEVMKLTQTFQKNISTTLILYIDEIKTNQIEIFPDGAVHQATTNAIGFLKKLFDYPSIEDIVLDAYKRNKIPINEDASAVQRYANELLKSVEHNIASKAKEYKSASLSWIFVLNNHYYVYTKLQETKFAKLIPKQQIDQYKQLYEKDAERYVQVTWSKIFASFEDPEQKMVAKRGKYSRSAKRELKKRLTNFNTMFVEIYHAQRSYSLFHLELKEMVRKMNIDAVIPRYNQFVKTYCSIPFTKESRVSTYLSFEESALQDMLLRFFDEEREDTVKDTNMDNVSD